MNKHEIICENCDKKKKDSLLLNKENIDGVKLQTTMETHFIFVQKIVNLIMFLRKYYHYLMKIDKKL